MIAWYFSASENIDSKASMFSLNAWPCYFAENLWENVVFKYLASVMPDGVLDGAISFELLRKLTENDPVLIGEVSDILLVDAVDHRFAEDRSSCR